MPLTPLMVQFNEIKSKYPDAILLFRVGDFYETFFNDAEIASKELDLVLTGKDCGLEERAPMAGVPFHSANTYIAKLVSKGYKVAICEQLEDPSKAEGLVKRDVIKVITSGTMTDTSVLDETLNNYLSCIYINQSLFALSSIDITTGEMAVTQIDNKDDLLNELVKYNPAEIITNDETYIKKIIGTYFTVNINRQNSTDLTNCKNLIKNRYDNEDINAVFELDQNIIESIGMLLKYIDETQMVDNNNISSIKYYRVDEYLHLDKNTIANLELIETNRLKDKKGSLLWILDKTLTPMGARLIKKWIERPLINIENINERLDAVEDIYNNSELSSKLIDALKNIKDFERTMGRVVYKSANAKDLTFIKKSISNLPSVKNTLKNFKAKFLMNLYDKLDTLEDIYNLINDSINEDAPVTLNDGYLIKNGYDSEVDRLRKLSTDAKDLLMQIENQEKEKTGIKNLKIKYNKVFGYFIEITNSYLNLVPDYYIRKQTLVNCERFVTEELKKVEQDILGAEDKVKKLEYDIFIQIRDKIALQYIRVSKSAQIIAQIDVINSLALCSKQNGYIRPTLSQNKVIEIVAGKHPVVEKIVSSNDIFVPNDAYLDTDKHMISIITGPNMAGKSTYMRQIALIVIMAQMGCFVPAKKAKIGIVDKIFTRIGAADDLSTGQSTFMVEMNEVANIVKNASGSSLLILDEVGRGTSTHDGISIAWAVVEYIAKKIKARTLFATHYHELVEIEDELDCVKNYNILVKEENGKVDFLRKIVKGPTDKSYGIQVAKLAGLPDEIINNAHKILQKLELTHIENEVTESYGTQLNIFDMGYEKIINRLKSIDINNLTPLEALNILNGLKNDLV